eukprot:756646_1
MSAATTATDGTMTMKYHHNTITKYHGHETPYSNTKQSPMTFSNANYHEIPSKTYHSNGIKLESIVTHYINHQSDHVIYYGGVSTLIFGLFRKGEESDVISPINANIVPNAAQNLNLNINTLHLQLEYNHKASNTGMTGSTRIYCTLFIHMFFFFDTFCCDTIDTFFCDTVVD